MKEKYMNKEKGFTLAELLIVVAIISALVAISIPIFSSQLDKARASTDAANVRAAKAAAVTDYMTNEVTTDPITYYYDADSGKAITDATTAAGYKGYGKSSTDIDVDNASGIPKDKIVSITVSDGKTTAAWVLGSSGNSGNTGLAGELTASTTWDSIKSKINNVGMNFAAGTLISDNGKLYLVYKNSEWIGIDENGGKAFSSMAEAMAVNPNSVEEITSSTSYYSESTIKGTGLAGITVKAGEICNYNGKYYVSPDDITYSDGWKCNPETQTGNWKIIK